jgi:hypothetical protein
MLQVIGRHADALDRYGGEQPAEVLRAARRESTGTVSLVLDCETTRIEP